MTTSINVDQELALILAPGAPSVAEDQALGLIVEQRLVPQIISNYIDQQLALIVEQRIANLVQLISGGYQNAAGIPISYGYLEIGISPQSPPASAFTIGDEIVERGDIRFRVTLDVNGNVVAGQYVYAGANAAPTFSYQINVFAQDGTLVSGAPQIISVPNSSPYYNLSESLVPVNPPGFVG